MRRPIRIALLALLLSALAAAAQADPSHRLVEFEVSSFPKLRAVVDTQSGPAEAPAPFSAADFVLLEDGKEGKPAEGITKFRDTDMGLALIVAIDVSRSMEGRPLNAVRQGLTQLVSKKRDKDRVSVLSFADEVHWETRWDASGTVLSDAFRNLRTRGNFTRLYDAIQQAMDEFAAQARQDPAFPTRMCLLVLSDGHDEGSHTTFNQLLTRLQASRMRLDAVGLAHSGLWLGNLQKLANAGFGGYRVANSSEALSQLLGHGIDVLLDLPTLDFESLRRFSDNKVHGLGVEHLPSHWRGELTIQLPIAPWFLHTQWQLAMLAVLALAVIGGLLMFRKPRRPSAQPQAVTTGPPVIASNPARKRIETVAETNASPAASFSAVKRATDVEPRATTLRPPPSIPVEPQPAAKPARVNTTFAPAEAGAAIEGTLIVEQGPYAGQRFPLSGSEFWIGSSTNNHLCLSADQAVSGNHACIRREGRFFRLYDNGSLNNTMMNGRGIGSEVVLLQNGDLIQVGRSELRLEL